MNTNKVSRGLMSSLQRILLAGLAIVILFAAMPTGKARAAGEIFWPTTIRCGLGKFDMRLNIYGAYEGEWASVRNHFWFKYPRSTTWTYAVTPWRSMQLSSNILTGGWSSSGPIPAGTLVQVKTDVQFSYYGRSTPVYSQLANHFDYLTGSSSTFCMVY